MMSAKCTTRSRNILDMRNENIARVNAVRVDHLLEKAFIMPSRPLEGCIEKRVQLPGNLINSQNKLSFFTNVGTIMDAVPYGIEVRILWQVSKEDPSNLFSLNFHKGSRLVPGINPFKDFILVVRVSGKGSSRNFKQVLNVFIRALSNHGLLRAGSVEVDKKISPYVWTLAHIKIIKPGMGHHRGRKKTVKFADTVNDHIFKSLLKGDDDVFHEDADSDAIPDKPDSMIIIDLDSKPPRTI